MGFSLSFWSGCEKCGREYELDELKDRGAKVVRQLRPVDGRTRTELETPDDGKCVCGSRRFLIRQD